MNSIYIYRRNSISIRAHVRRFAVELLCCLFIGAAAFPLPAEEDDISAAAPGAPELGSRAAVLMDAATGAVLYTKNPDMEIPPASLTKLVTAHLALRETAAGRAALDETVTLPPESWARNQPPRSSLMHLAPGQTVTLRDLLLGLAIPSGNDAAAAVALRFAPSMEEFAELMNREVRALGLVKTRFVEPSGVSEYNSTTAMEFIIFCREYINLYPETLILFHSVPSFTFPRAENVPPAYRDNPGTETHYNHNRLLGVVEGVDGLKTGYIDESGYNIALTAERNNTRLIAVILGAPAIPRQGERVRDEDGAALLTWGFAQFKTLRPALEEPGPVRVWKGAERSAAIVFAEPLPFTARADRGQRISIRTEYLDPVVAPLPAGSPVGRVVFSDSRGELRSLPLVTADAVERGSFFRRLRDSIALFFRGLFR
jgi:D-alanyl-D-alanine carboxypeptidase (penicillin-binding protein 5/6)